MSEFKISVPGGESKRLKTGGKYCPADIVVNAEKSAPVEEKDVNFWDYDATLLYAYTLEELQSLTELPPLPAHEGLVCQGWNWTLTDLKAYGKPYDILPYYVTEDGATWYDLVNDTGRDITVTFSWKQYVGEGNPVLSFGDGSEPFSQSITSNQTVSCTHTYAPGTYRAKLSGFYHLGDINAVSDISDISSILLRNVFFGEYPKYLFSHAFRGCTNLTTATFSKNTNIEGTQIFFNCRNLKTVNAMRGDLILPSSIVGGCSSMKVLSLKSNIKGHYGLGSIKAIKRICFPDACTGFNGGVDDCEAITYVNIPDGVTSLPNNAFIRCYSLTKLDIPNSVTSIGSLTFYDCSALYKLRFNSVTPPTVANANAFSGIPAWCVVEVPAESLTTYQQATNYGTIAAQMVGV